MAWFSQSMSSSPTRYSRRRLNLKRIFDISYEYVNSLKPKATAKKKAKTLVEGNGQ
jgi:hypothetical protein